MTENTSNNKGHFRAAVLGETLKRAITTLAKNTCIKHGGLPVFNQCLIRSYADNLELITFDREYTPNKLLVSAKIECEGAVVVPFKVLKELAPFIGDLRLDLEETNTGLQIRESGHTTNLNAHFAVEDFPDVDIEHEWLHVAEFPAKQFYTAWWQLENHVAKNDTRPILCGINLQTTDTLDTILYATNSHALQKTTFTQSARLPAINIVIPALKGIRDTLRVKKADGLIAVYVDSQNEFVQLVNEVSGKKQVVRLIEGTFPNVERVFPSQYTHSGVVYVDMMRRTTKQLKPYAGKPKGHNTVGNPLHISIQGRELSFEVTDHEKGTLSRQVETNSAKPMPVVRLAYSLLHKALEKLNKDTCTLRFFVDTHRLVRDHKLVIEQSQDTMHSQTLIMAIRDENKPRTTTNIIYSPCPTNDFTKYLMGLSNILYVPRQPYTVSDFLPYLQNAKAVASAASVAGVMGVLGAIAKLNYFNLGGR